MSPPGSGDATARVCYNMTVFMRGDFWHAETPTNRSLPSLNSQLVIVMLVTRILMVAFKPLHQPRIVADILVSSLIALMDIEIPLYFDYPNQLFFQSPLRIILVKRKETYQPNRLTIK